MPAGSRLVVMVGLAALFVAGAWWLQVNSSVGLPWAIVLGAIGPVPLMRGAWKQVRNWSGITALVMIPYACLGIMDIVAGGGALSSGLAIGFIAIATFFAALDAGRREANQPNRSPDS